MAGASLASVQLLPTWELKQRSSRVVTSSDYDPAYGHMPPLYASQLIAPWYWYSLWACDEDNLVRDIAEFAAPWYWFGPTHDPDRPDLPYDLQKAVQQCPYTTTTTGTNKIEAHLYCGLVPVALAIWATIIWFRHRRGQQRIFEKESVMEMTTGYWLIAGLFALVYATAILLPIGRHLPGFSFFRGPGRYGIVTTLAIALLAGQMFGQLMAANFDTHHSNTRRDAGVRFNLRRSMAGQPNGEIHHDGLSAANQLSKRKRSSQAAARRAQSTTITCAVCERRKSARNFVRTLVPGDRTGGVC